MELELVKNNILTLRGQRVMLDFHLAELYGVETRVLKQAVRRNMNRFPADFMFELRREEAQAMVSQIVIPSFRSLGGTMPYAFTEQGVAMLSSVLRSERAVEVNIAIMRAFMLMRQHLTDYQSLREELARLETDVKDQFANVHEALAYLLSPAAEREPIGFRPGTTPPASA